MVSAQGASFRWPDVAGIRAELTRLASTPVDSVAWSAVAGREEQFLASRRGSQRLTREAAELIPGGSNHSLASNSPFPLYFDRAVGAHVWDVDGNRYIDFVRAGGAILLGAADADVASQTAEVMARCAPCLSLAHPAEISLARMVREHMPSAERLRMTGSGTEAVMGAVRIARAFTGAAHVIKVGGAYHGWSDQLVLGLQLPGTGRHGVNGIPDQALSLTEEVPPDDLLVLRSILERNAESGGTAAVIIEPLGPQSGTLPADATYPAAVEELCREFGALLIFDEVVTGFRLGLGGVQGYLSMRPDLTVLGKCLTGGYPAAGAIAGRADVMATLTSGHPSFALVAGTLSANPMSSAAGCATLAKMAEIDAAGLAAKAGGLLCTGLADLIAKYELPFVTYHFGSIVHLNTSGFYQLTSSMPGFAEQVRQRRNAMRIFAMLAAIEGLIIPVTGRLFMSVSHDDDVVGDALQRFDLIFRSLASRE